MTSPGTTSAAVPGPLARSARLVDPYNLLVGFLASLLLAAFAFTQEPVGLFCLAVALIIGAALPQAGIVSIAFAIATLPLVRLGGDLADIRPDELMMVVVVAGTAIRALLKRDVPRSEVTRPVLIFVVVAAASMALKLAVTDYEIPFLSVAFPLAKHVLRLMLFLTILWVGSRYTRALPTIKVALVGGGVMGALFGIAQSLFAPVEDFLVVFYPSIRGGAVRLFWGQRAFAAFDGNPNHLSVSMLILGAVALATADAASSTRERRLWWLAAVVMLFGVVASASRASGLIAIIMMLVMWLRGKRVIYRNALVAMSAYVVLVPNLLRTRVLQLIIVSDGTLSPESDLLKKWLAWTNPFTRRETLKMTDNFYIDTVVNFWPLALVAFLWLMWVIYRRLRNERRCGAPEFGEVTGAYLGFVMVAVLSMAGAFFSVPRVSEILWMVLGLAWAWFALRDSQDAAALPPLTDDSSTAAAPDARS